jgi:lipoate-protein ligase A
VSQPTSLRRLDVSRVRALSQPLVIERTVAARLLVLGSSQPAALVRHDAALEVVRRRGGGGAVLVDPEQTIWIDVWLPSTTPEVHDVRGLLGTAGEHFRRALGALGVDGLEVLRPERAAERSVACFAGLGFGELVDTAGRKLLGLTAWRSREGALVQSALYRARDARLCSLLELPDEERGALRRALLEQVTDLDTVAPGPASTSTVGRELASALASALGCEREVRAPEIEGAPR